MGKSKKKPFIDKKNASTYHLLHRSQRDVGGGDDDDNNNNDDRRVILWPSPHNRPETNEKVLTPASDAGKMTQIKDQMKQLGLVDDYDYDQHLRPITGSGTFVDSAGQHQGESALLDARSKLLEEEDVKEVSRQLESIALTPDCMDPEIAQALFGDFEDGDFEEILDDFCVTAAQEAEDEEEEFDYDAHIRSLMERAAKQDRGEPLHPGVDVQEHDWGKRDHDFFAHVKALHEGNEEDDDESGHYSFDLDEEGGIQTTPGVVSALSPDEEQALCAKFEEALREYDSDEVGDLDEECEDIQGSRPLEGDAQVEAALDEFLVEKKDEIFMEGTRRLRDGGSGFSALVGQHMVAAGDLDNVPFEEDPVPVKEVLAEANEVLANPEMEPPPEEILIDGQSYFSERARNPWDCESILTTYSNLDNNPAMIESTRRSKKKKNRRISPESPVPEDEPVQIQLSNKTGLPLGVFPSRSQYYEGDDTIVSVNKGEARKKHESKDEKKARKKLVKQERQFARIQKKVIKEAFADEYARRAGEILADDVGGKSVFRYS